jgi:hypothetical protein
MHNKILYKKIIYKNRNYNYFFLEPNHVINKNVFYLYQQKIKINKIKIINNKKASAY